MRAILPFALSALALVACGERQPAQAPDSGQEVRARALEAQTTPRITGAERQQRRQDRVIRTVYLCNNSERLAVDFDNSRDMATVRNASGEAVDLFEENAADGLWYRASGYELRGRGAEATWIADGREPTDCRAID